MQKNQICYLAIALFLLSLFDCVSESSKSLAVEKPQTAFKPWYGPRSPVAVGKFDNRSSFQRGIFFSGEDRLGSQAKGILVTQLQQTNRFTVLDRENMEEAQYEAGLRGEEQNLTGASFIITGQVAEFGRREESAYQMFGIGREKKQFAYAIISLNVVNIISGETVYSVQGAGEYELSTVEVAGFGATSSYDASLNGKVLDLAIREAVDRLSEGMDSGDWRP